MVGRVAGIDCGTNSVRLLIADASGGADGLLVDVARRMEIVRLGQGVDRTGRLAPEALERTRVALAGYAEEIVEAGVDRVRMVATSATRDAANAGDFHDMVVRTLGAPPEVVSGEEEARLSFVGATRTMLQPSDGTIAVIDVGGGSTEIAVGEPDGKMAWSASFRIGSGFLADSYLRSDPPSVDELEKVRTHVTGTFEGLEPPPAAEAVAVGGTATSLRRLLGAELSHETLERGIRVLSSTPIDEVAARFELPSGAAVAA